MTEWPYGSGEMAERIRAHDWASTPLGSLESWPERLKAVVELMLASPLVSSVALTADRLLLYNDAAARLYGARHPGALGRPLRETFPDSYPAVAPLYDRVFADESVEVRGQPVAVGTGGGGEVFDAYLTPVRAADGAIIGAHMIGLEIGSRARAETALRESEQRLQRVLETDAVAVLFFRRDGVLTDANDVFLRMTGYSREDLATGRLTWQQMTPPEWLAVSQEQMDQFLVNGRIGPYEKEYLRKDGTRAWMLFAGRDLGDGTIVEFGVDTTDRKRAEDALRVSEEKYRTLFSSIDEGFVVCELLYARDGKPFDVLVLETNSRFDQMLRVERAVGKRASEIFPDAEPSWYEAYGRVIQTGESIRLENYLGPLGRWFELYLSRVGGASSRRLAMVFNDITNRKRAEAALRESEERQAFLLKLSDALRPLVDPAAVQIEAMRVLIEQIGMQLAQYWELDPRDSEFLLSTGYAAGAAPLPQRLRMNDFGPFVQRTLFTGQTIVINNTQTDTRLNAAEREAHASLDIGACIGVPLMKGGRFVAGLGIYHPVPHVWTEQEIAVAAEVTERTWDAVGRARAEARLRESEERFAQFARASSGGIWIRNAGTLAMEYASPAMGKIYGLDPDAICGEIQQWAAMIVPDDRDIALEHIARARQGESVVHEFRIQRPSDKAFRWIRSTDFPLHDDGHVQRIGGIAEDITEEKLSIEHQRVLLAELQHRVRNIMAIIRSIVSRTADGAASIDDYTELLSGRLLTLARVQVLLTRAAAMGVSVASIVKDELSAQANHADQFDAIGLDIVLSPKAAETMTLAVHELTTNALKYGALSAPEGKVTVRWAVVEKRGTPWLTFDWNETGAPAQPMASGPRRIGFGSELIERRIPYELGGRGMVTINPGGAQCHLEFPLKNGASVLETDAPQRVDVFGGAIDMAGAADLSGQRILVVEDDYYLANDTARALKGAGAEVIGPCPNEDAAHDAITDVLPTGAILDINLNGGRSFELARELKERDVPFVFVTGYDQEVIRTEFEAVTRLQKPVEFRRIVDALADSLAIEL